MSPSLGLLGELKNDICEAPSLPGGGAASMDVIVKRRVGGWERWGMTFIPSSCSSSVDSGLSIEGGLPNLALFSLLGNQEHLG